MSSLSPPHPLPPLERDGRERRSEDTRRALIAAGLDLFGDYGIKGTTSRMLATASRTNVAAITYHFGSKEGLYLAVVGSIAERMDQHLSKTGMPDPAAVAGASLSPAAAVTVFANLIDHLAGLMVDSEEVRIWARIIVREQSQPTLAFETLYRGRMERIQGMLASLIGAAIGSDPAAADTKIRAHALIGQVLGFATSRESLLRALGVKRLSPTHRETIRRVLRQHVEACLCRTRPASA